MLAIAIRATFEAVSFVAFLVLLFSGTYLANEIYLAVKRAYEDKPNEDLHKQNGTEKSA